MGLVSSYVSCHISTIWKDYVYGIFRRKQHPFDWHLKWIRRIYSDKYTQNLTAGKAVIFSLQSRNSVPYRNHLKRANPSQRISAFRLGLIGMFGISEPELHTACLPSLAHHEIRPLLTQHSYPPFCIRNKHVSLCEYSSKKKGCILVYIYYNKT